MKERNKKKDAEALNIFLTVLFNNEMVTKFPDIEITDDNRLLYFKLWCSGVSAGMELDLAVNELNKKD